MTSMKNFLDVMENLGQHFSNQPIKFSYNTNTVIQKIKKSFLTSIIAKQTEECPSSAMGRYGFAKMSLKLRPDKHFPPHPYHP